MKNQNRFLNERSARAKAEERANTTRPLLDRAIAEMIQTLEALLERFQSVEQEIKIIRHEIGLLREDIRNKRMERAELAERERELEHRPN